MRGAHAALSPSLGAPASPVPWHAVQTLSKVDLPDAAPPCAAFGAGGGIVGAASAACAGAAGVAGGCGAFGSIATTATGARRLATAASDIAGSSLSERAP